LPAGTRVWVPASVQGAPWYLISQDGEGKGYVSNALMTKAATSVAIQWLQDGDANRGRARRRPGVRNLSRPARGADGQWVMTRV
jgi:hypothetical protein